MAEEAILYDIQPDKARAVSRLPFFIGLIMNGSLLTFVSIDITIDIAFIGLT